MFTVIYRRGANGFHLQPFHTEDEAEDFMKRLSMTSWDEKEAVIVEGEIRSSMHGNVITHHRQAKDTRR